MYHSAVLWCLLLSIVQATATCTQQGTQGCQQNLVTAACNGLRETGATVPPFCRLPSSCLEIHSRDQSTPSGNYQIELSNGTVINVYCDMNGTNCNGQGGWTRVAFVNMSHPGATCPPGLTQMQRSNLNLCSRDNNNLVQSAFITTLELQYSEVCGRLRGYQDGAPEAFADYLLGTPPETIDQTYADGVSITYSTNPRKHIWTYAIGFVENAASLAECPCNTGSIAGTPPYVGNNYYCESATTSFQAGVLYTNDVLWDGLQCNNVEGQCCTNNNLPWFSTELSESTQDDLELRIMFGRPRNDEGVGLELIELYIR